jgi:hypothetical protein
MLISSTAPIGGIGLIVGTTGGGGVGARGVEQPATSANPAMEKIVQTRHETVRNGTLFP